MTSSRPMSACEESSSSSFASAAAGGNTAAVSGSLSASSTAVTSAWAASGGASSAEVPSSASLFLVAVLSASAVAGSLSSFTAVRARTSLSGRVSARVSTSALSVDESSLGARRERSPGVAGGVVAVGLLTRAFSVRFFASLPEPVLDTVPVCLERGERRARNLPYSLPEASGSAPSFSFFFSFFGITSDSVGSVSLALRRVARDLDFPPLLFFSASFSPSPEALSCSIGTVLPPSTSQSSSVSTSSSSFPSLSL
mmetsp:Transcript_11926/g.48039  ORF Transcript_11926/g.48039 Transcript_11926/m.48039 type:complete len:255 (-) Transcript_11926:2596-3360(-)